MKRNKIYFGLALIVAAALGYGLHPDTERVVEKVVDIPEKRPAAVIPDWGEAATITALRQRVHDLEARLAASQKSEETAVSNAIARVRAERPDRPPPGGPGRERLEELKTRDPARFAQVTNRLAKMHQDRKSREAARVSFLASVVTSNMSAQDKETHDAYQELLARREALEEQMHQPDITDDTRRGLMDQMREIDHQMRTLGESERKVLLNEVAQAIGMQGDAAVELVETISDVFDATEGNGGPPGPPPDAPPGAMP